MKPKTRKGKTMTAKVNRQELAKECDEHVRRAWRSVKKHSMEIGWYGRILKAENLFQELGYADEVAYWQAAGVGHSTWYKMIRIAEAFAHLTLDEFLALSIENADQLSTLNEAARHDEKLLAQAAKQTAIQFEETLAEHTAEVQHRPVAELSVTWKLHMKRGQRTVIEQRLRQWQQEHGIADEAYALEMLIAEYTERLTLVGYMTETIQRLERSTAGTSSKDAAALRTEIRTLVTEMQEALRLVVGEGNGQEEAA